MRRTCLYKTQVKFIQVLSNPSLCVILKNQTCVRNIDTSSFSKFEFFLHHIISLCAIENCNFREVFSSSCNPFLVFYCKCDFVIFFVQVSFYILFIMISEVREFLCQISHQTFFLSKKKQLFPTFGSIENCRWMLDQEKIRVLFYSR